MRGSGMKASEFHRLIENRRRATRDRQRCECCPILKDSVIVPRDGELSPYQRGYALLMDGQDAAAVNLFEQAHAAGDARATFKLGWVRFKGILFHESPASAPKYFRAAADAGIIEGLHYLAMCTEHGFGMRKNERRAFSLYVEAANAGNPFALDDVMRCLGSGIGVTANKELWRLMEILHAGEFNPPQEERPAVNIVKLEDARLRARRRAAQPPGDQG